MVVHNVYFNDEQLLSNAQIQSQIEVLNEDFRAVNVEPTDLVFHYRELYADMEINFVLADQDPQGNPHSGIIRRETEIPGIGGSFTEQRRDLCYDTQGGSSAWCTDCYLNIWVADLGENIEGLAGIGIFPSQIASGEVPRAEDGVYIQYDNFGRGGSAEPPYNLGRTCTHEVGHYLNLLHLWGPSTPPDNCPPSVCCPDPQYDDLVDDTGKQTTTYAGQCPNTGGTLNSCPGTSDPDNYQNFMGYVEDACALMFTQGQKERVWSALQTFRPGLLNTNCTTDICLVGTNTPQATNGLFENVRWMDGELRGEALEPGLSWRLYNTLGQPIDFWKTEVTGRFNHKLSAANAGVYFLVVSKGKLRQVQKIIF